MTKTVLLTIGRLPKALDFARSFNAAGWRVLVAEPFKWHLTAVSNSVAQSFVVPPPSLGKQAYLRALAEIVSNQKVDLVLPLSEETLHVAHLPMLLGDKAKVFVPAKDTILSLHDKAAFIALAQEHDLGVPETAILGSAESQIIADSCDYVIKPIFSCSGRGVSLHKAGQPLPKPQPNNANERALVQRRLSGTQYSTFAITHQGQVQTNIIYKGTVFSGSVAVAFERVEMDAIDKWVTDFVGAISHSGFISFDFFVDQDGVARAIECNPRVTSGVHFIETDNLAHAILTPFLRPIRLKPVVNMMQFYPTLTEVQSSMFSSKFIDNLKIMRGSRDVTWSSRDPLPLMTMPITAFNIIAQAIRTKKSFGEVSTDDISWFEGETLTEGVALER